jgi:hypothetical protein
MSVAARFYVSGLERNAYQPDATIVKMQPVTRGEQNRDWAAATPSGQIQMTILNSSAAVVFADRLGEEFEITFTPVKGAAG